MTKNNTYILMQVELPVKCSSEEFSLIYNERYKNKITYEYIRKELNLEEDIHLKLNGTFGRDLYLIDVNESLYKIRIRVQTAVWYDKESKMHYVSIIPSFIKKYCPVSLSALEYTVCEMKEGDNIFDHIDDPQGILECEDTITRPIKQIEAEAAKHKYAALLNSTYTKVYNTSINPADFAKENAREFKVIYELILTARKYFGSSFNVLSRINKLLFL